jgi:hypothetical protein
MMAAGFVVTDEAAPIREADPGIAEVADRFRGDVAALTPVRTGALRAGWTVSGSEGEYRVANGVRYAVYVEFGTSKMRPAAMVGRALAGAR